MVTYTNIFKTRFVDPFWAILKGEMSIFISMDNEFIERGSQWFNLTPISDEGDSMRSGGTHRIYTVGLRYYRSWKSERDRNWYNEMTIMGERVKRLIGNSSNTSNWHDMQVDINYNPDRDEIPTDWAIIDFIITFRIEEVW